MFLGLKNKLRDFFIPSLQNELRPYSLRYGTLIFLVAVAISIELLFYAYVNTAFKNNLLLGSVIDSIQTTVADVLPQVIIEETNNNRIANNETPLIANSVLSLAAKMKAEDMANNGYFSHEGPNGEMAWDWMAKANYNFNYAGENLAVNFFDAKDVVKAWMNSPKHRENILNENFQEVGIGAARGRLDGKDTVFVVQMLASPAELPTQLAIIDAPINPVEKPVPPKSAKLVSTSTASSTVAGIFATTTATDSPVALATTSSTSVAAATLPSNVSVLQKWMVSPRHIARDVYIALLSYMAMALLIPMYMIYHKHASSNQWLRFREIFILFRQPIISALVTFMCISVVLFINYALSRSGTNIYNFSVQIGTGADLSDQ